MVKRGIPEKNLANCCSYALTLCQRDPPVNKLGPNLIFGRFPHYIYNVKLEIGGRITFMLRL